VDGGQKNRNALFVGCHRDTLRDGIPASYKEPSPTITSSPSTTMIITAHNPRYFIPSSTPPCNQGLESSTFKAPILDGSTPFPELYDWHYHHSPDHPALIFDDPSSPGSGGIRVYRWKTVVPVIHRTGRHILSLFNLTLPLNPERIPVIAVLAAAGICTYLV
jgi:hypothetical protein